MLKKILILLIFCGLHLCQDGDEPTKLYRLFTKTHYMLSRQLDDFDGFMKIKNDDQFQPATDKFLHMYGNFRHGSRYPSHSDPGNAQKALDKLAGKIPNELYEKLNTVLQNMRSVPSCMLSPSGREEHRMIGDEYGQIFAHLYQTIGSDRKPKPKDLKEEDFVFGHTDFERAITSMRGFMDGFLPKAQSVGVNYTGQPKNVNRFLRFYTVCQLYITTVAKNNQTKVEKNKFMKAKLPVILKTVRENFNAPNLDWTDGDVHAWGSISGMELAINRTATWVKYLDSPDNHVLELMEYATDLSAYWWKGPGNKINYQMACEVIVEMIRLFDSILAGKSQELGRFYFSHAETLIPLLNILGLFRGDPPLKHDQFEQNKNREFKTTRMSPFATNFVIVLFYRGQKMSLETAFVQLYFKGKPYYFPYCGKKSICKYSILRGFLEEYLTDCKVDVDTEDCKYMPAKGFSSEIRKLKIRDLICTLVIARFALSEVMS
ncbi:hypothetical protein HELRODRAFT_182785 [Helobdella robusta]|uniref:Multiple inositol polyphosphate phosphatase 1 n=1 Tax=Helobdella robusta TaxID=6412 RepID=T1FIQ4_HELRO|nr:hypothetical protein HELRODRAFT_182785 [Helobdella robusta]ESN90184.1 hypothetical protein HELRODRAFT_182785 [Helobdella robusta]